MKCLSSPQVDKRKRAIRIKENKQKTNNKMQYLIANIPVLNINGLNAPTKDKDWPWQ